MHTSIRACFLYFFYNPYMSLFNSKDFFIYLYIYNIGSMAIWPSEGGVCVRRSRARTYISGRSTTKHPPRRTRAEAAPTLTSLALAHAHENVMRPYIISTIVNLRHGHGIYLYYYYNIIYYHKNIILYFYIV